MPRARLVASVAVDLSNVGQRRVTDQSPELTWHGDVPVATRFDDPYFSLGDGLAETRHVFLAGNGLPERFRDGFQIAETDLQMRGYGDLIGTAQSGVPRFRIADLDRQATLMAIAQSDARKALADDPDLSSPRGATIRVLLWLMRQDEAIRLISVA